MRFWGILLLTSWNWLSGAEVLPPACAPRPLILAHVMPWFESKAVSGRWGWHWTMGKTNADNGVLATHERPWLGAYDSSDPALVATQVAMMKASCIDGAIIDWNGPGGFDDYAMIHRNTLLLIAELKKAGLKFALCVEDNTGKRFMSEGKLTRAEATANVAASFAWADAHWLGDPDYVRLGGRPTLFIFGPQYLDEAEWTTIRGSMKQNPLTFALPHLSRRPGIDGAFGWVPVSEGKTVEAPAWTAELATLYAQERAAGRPFVALAFPGYHDFYAQAGVGPSYGRIDSRAGRTFEESLDQAILSGSPIVQVATWNDYGEGTNIEPTTANPNWYPHLQAIRKRLGQKPESETIHKILAEKLREHYLNNQPKIDLSSPPSSR